MRGWIDIHLLLPELARFDIVLIAIEFERVLVGVVDMTICDISYTSEELVDMDAFGFSFDGDRIELAQGKYISDLILCPF